MIKTLLKNQFCYSITTRVIIVLLGVLNMIFINRLLGTTLKGEYTYLLNIINLAILIFNLGIYESYPYFKRKNIENLENKFVNNSITQALVYIFISLVLCSVFREIKLIVVFIIVPILILNRQINFIVMIENINLRNRINIWTEFLYTIVLLIIFCLKLKSILAVLFLLVFRAVAQLVLAIIFFKLKISFRFIDLKLLKDSIKFGFIAMVSLLMTTLNYKVDVLILKLFTDYSQIGLYSIGVLLAEQAWLISDAFKEVLFSKSAKKDNIEEILLCIKVNIVLTILMILAIIIFGQEFIIILFGKEFADSYMVTVILFAGTLGMVLFKLIYPIFIANGKQIICLWVLTASVVINVALNFLLIPKFGITGSAFASVISYNACGCLFLMIFCKQFKLNLLNSILPSNEDIKILKYWIDRVLKLKSSEYKFERN